MNPRKETLKYSQTVILYFTRYSIEPSPLRRNLTIQGYSAVEAKVPPFILLPLVLGFNGSSLDRGNLSAF